MFQLRVGLVLILCPSVATAFVRRLASSNQLRSSTLIPEARQSKTRSLVRLPTTGTDISSLWNGVFNSSGDGGVSPKKPAGVLIQRFVQAYNFQTADGVNDLVSLLTEDCVWDDFACYSPAIGEDAIGRRLRLRALGTNAERQCVIDEIVPGDKSNVGALFHEEDANGSVIGNSRGIVLLSSIDSQWNTIGKVTWVMEKASKTGEAGLRVLSLASSVMDKTGYNPVEPTTSVSAKSRSTLSPPERYFAAWSVRDMDGAVDLFSEDVTYDDTAFPKPFSGKDSLSKHLKLCAASFPETFTFEVDEVLCEARASTMMVEWHVENKEKPLPFTRGVSYYEISNNKIRRGIDFVDSEPIKTKELYIVADIVVNQVKSEPIRLLPMAVWLAYIYIVFFSDGIMPGANVLQLEQRTWEEVLNLSLNFFLVAPVLGLPFSPVVHPMLEGVFNVLLSWAAMFAGFLSDDRKDKPNVLAMVPTVVGMQFLTSAFLLPYLATRSTEQRDDVCEESLANLSVVTENRAVGPAMALVGFYSIVWAFFGRAADFGALADRWSSFQALIEIDRVGASFIVDLVVFSLFQGWLVDDDLKRRGVAIDDENLLRLVGKFLPFFGMAAYLALRPALPKSME